jgi:hypothetical protein
MSTQKELYKEDTIKGLCWLAQCMWINHLITKNELSVLKKFIWDNPPKVKFNAFYHWSPGLWTPRIAWIKRQIKKLN